MQNLTVQYWQIALILSVLLVLVAATHLLRLELTKQVFVASLRTLLQLSLIGFILTWLFANQNYWLLSTLLFAMTAIAAHACYSRVQRKSKSLFLHSFLSIAIPSWCLSFLFLPLLVDDGSWFAAKWAVPLLGILLGNSLNGISLGLNIFQEELRTRRIEIENALALGATAWEATHDLIKKTLRQALTPILNGMTVVGIVSLPGTMTGQLLAGVNPADTVRLQIFIMFLLCAVTLLGSLLALLFRFRQCFNQKHQYLGAN